jgi:hypothetical protein
MIINADRYTKPKKRRYCEACNGVIDGPFVRVYGMAERGDKPYPLFYCDPCWQGPLCSWARNELTLREIRHQAMHEDALHAICA